MSTLVLSSARAPSLFRVIPSLPPTASFRFQQQQADKRQRPIFHQPLVPTSDKKGQNDLLFTEKRKTSWPSVEPFVHFVFSICCRGNDSKITN